MSYYRVHSKSKEKKDENIEDEINPMVVSAIGGGFTGVIFGGIAGVALISSMEKHEHKNR
jgi:hypothetical protein